MNWSKLLFDSKEFIKRQAPLILSCMAAGGVAMTGYLAAKGSQKVSESENFTEEDHIKTSVKAYAPAVAMGMVTVGCIFGANVLNRRSQANLAAAYALLDQTYRDYKKGVSDTYGEDAEEQVVRQVVKNRDISTRFGDVSLPLKGNEMLFYDFYSNRLFTSTMEKVIQAEYFTNRDLVTNDAVYLNEFYERVGLDPIDEGFELGWCTDGCLELYGKNWIDFQHYFEIIDDGILHRDLEGMKVCMITYKEEPMAHVVRYL